MPEKFPYNLEKAEQEAEKMQAKIKSGGAKDYVEAEKLVGNQIIANLKKLNPNVLAISIIDEKSIKELKKVLNKIEK